MVEVGDRIRLSSMKGPGREGLVTAVTGAQRVRPTPPTDELQVAVNDGITQHVTGLARGRSRPDDSRERTHPVTLPATLRQPADAPRSHVY